MRRGLAALVAVVIVAVAIIAVRAERNASTGRVDVVFDTAKGMVPGQLVKIAGARAGHVDAVHLTADHRARMVLRVEDRFLPFHADATCRILPEGPISENYVECDPGVLRARPLPEVAGVPTVPVAQTTAPVSVQDLLNVFAAPTQLRLRLLFNELGIGTAGRGADLNDLLRRANPALRQAQSLLAVVNGQRAALGRAIDQTDVVLGRVGASDGAVRRFVDRAADVARTTGTRHGALAASVQRLPAMLTATRAGLHSIDRATAAGTPLLASLERSGPQLAELTQQLPAFAKAAVPAVRATTAAAVEGRRGVRPLTKIAGSLRALGATTSVVSTLRDFMVSARDKGAIENLLRTAYSLANLTALYNGVSHVVTLFAGVQIQCIVLGASAPGCDQRFFGPRKPLNDPGNAPVVRRLLREALAALQAKDRAARPGAARRPLPGRLPHLPETHQPAPAPHVPIPKPVQDVLDALGGGLRTTRDDANQLLDFLLR